MISLFKPAPASTRVAHERIDREYRRLRWQVFTGIFIGYAAYYLVRKNFALAIPDILKDYPQYSKAQLGWAMTGLSIAYGVSKFLMGSVSDRSNPRWFMPLGLLLSAGVTFRSARFRRSTVAHGDHHPADAQRLVQRHGMAAVRQDHGALVQHEGARRDVSRWNVAHNVGGGLVAKLALVGVMLFHDWGAKFYFNAAVAALVAVVVLSCCATRRRAAGFRRSRSTRTIIRRSTRRRTSAR